MPLIDGPAGSLWFESVGEGAPTSIWVHGLTGSTRDLPPLAARTTGTRVLMDLRGHGRSHSPKPEAGYSVKAYRDDVETVADAVGASRVFAISSGASAVIGLLTDEPTRFDRVALLLPAAGGASGSAAEGLLALARDLETMPIAEMAEIQASADAPLYTARPHWREIIRARTLQMNQTGVPRAIRAYVDGPPPEFDEAALRRVCAPVLILGHEGDPVHEAAQARRLAAAFTDASLEIWPEPLAMYDDVDAFARLIGEFLSA